MITDEKLAELMEENGISDDMTDACRAYLDATTADDLDDFEEAYQGQYDSDEDFAQNQAGRITVLTGIWPRANSCTTTRGKTGLITPLHAGSPAGLA